MIEYIKENTKDLLDTFRDLEEKLSAKDRKAEEKPVLSDAQRKDAFNTISEIAGSMDFGMMEDLLNDLEDYALSDEDAKLLRDIRSRLMELDWDGIAQITASAQL